MTLWLSMRAKRSSLKPKNTSKNGSKARACNYHRKTANPAKTRVVHTLQSTDGSEPGFNFLGFSIRQYLTKTHEKGYKTHTKPNLENQKRHKRKIRSNDYLYAREGDKSPKLYYQGMDQLFPNRGV